MVVSLSEAAHQRHDLGSIDELGYVQLGIVASLISTAVLSKPEKSQYDGKRAASM